MAGRMTDNVFFFLMIRRPPRSTQSRSSAASDVYKRQGEHGDGDLGFGHMRLRAARGREMQEGWALI